MLADHAPFADEDEGEPFDFDDSGDDTQVDPPPPAPLAPPSSNGVDQSLGNLDNRLLPGPDPRAPSTTANTALSATEPPPVTGRSAVAGGATAEGEETSAAEWTDDKVPDLPPPPPDASTEKDSRLTGLQPKC